MANDTMGNGTYNNLNNSVVFNFTVDFTSPNVTRNFLNNPVDNSNFSIRSSNQTFNVSVFDNLTLVGSVYFGLTMELVQMSMSLD